MALFRRERGRRPSRIRVGQRVVFRRNWERGDRRHIAVLVENNGDRGFTQPKTWKWAIKPTGLTAMNEVRVHRRGQPRNLSRTAPVSHGGTTYVKAHTRGKHRVRAFLRRAARR
jgi:hypothetical protein